MKIKDYKKSKLWRMSYVMLALLAFFLGSCDDGKEISIVSGSGGDPFNPASPIQVESIFPNTGGANQRVLISGKNFGNDPSKLEVFIGGQKASVVSVKDDCIYCMVPSKAFDGTIEVRVIDGDNTYISEASDIKYDYQRLVIVSDLLGKKDQYNNFDVKNGPFDDCGGVRNCNWMAWDPEYPELLYFSGDSDEDHGGDGEVRCIDFKNEQLYTMLNSGDIGNGGRRPRSIGFFNDERTGKSYMCVAIDQGGADQNAVNIFERIPDATKPCGFKWGNRKMLARYKQCNTVAFHPISGDMYFNAYEHGQFFEVKKETIQDIIDGTREDAARLGDGIKELFTIQDDGWECYFSIHPEGKYCIITVVNKNYMVRSDYNGETFTTPYVIVGQPQAANDYKDGVGTRARVYSPQQGIFVENPEYADSEDKYDYYFCDKHNHAVRVLNPTGKVSTFAGRGSASLNSNPWGHVNGDLRKEARFERPKGLAYDKENNVFYVGDSMNRCIRRIGLEETNE